MSNYKNKITLSISLNNEFAKEKCLYFQIKKLKYFNGADLLIA